MPAIYVFRNASDSLDITYQDLGGILSGGSTDPLQVILKNTGDSTSVSTKIRIIASIDFSNKIGTPVVDGGILSSNNPDPGTYDIVFQNPTTVKVNGGPDIEIIANGAFRNTNVIDGAYIVFSQDSEAGNSSTIVISEGYQNTQISQDNSGNPDAWNPTEIQVGNLFPANMSNISTSIIDGGTLALTNYNYVVTFVTDKGESLVSNRVNTTIDAEGKSILIEWQSMPAALSYNVYKGLNGGEEKFLASVAGNSYTDNGTIGVQENKTYPRSTQIDKHRFWIKAIAPTDATNALNPRKFKLRALGLSS